MSNALIPAYISNMPRVNAEILVWARKTAGLTEEEAVQKLDIKDARGVPAIDRLAALERGENEPTRAMLIKMAQHYRRSLITFYMSAPPPKGDRGQDFRTLPAGHSHVADALLDALIRDLRARQRMVRSVLEDEEEAAPLPFVGSLQMSDGVGRVLKAIRPTIKVDLAEFRAQKTSEEAFAVLRSGAEKAGVFVLLIGDLGSHHTAIDLETFRGFALADPIAPFVAINDRDAKTAWSFTLLHELTHLWLGQTGVSGASAEIAIERFCNEVAGEFLLPLDELDHLPVDDDTDLNTALEQIGEFARSRNVGRSMVAYRLYRAGKIGQDRWSRISATFREQWLRERATRRERDRLSETGPNYYVVRRHRLGHALLEFVTRSISEGSLTPTKAGKVLRVKPRNVEPLLSRAVANVMVTRLGSAY